MQNRLPPHPYPEVQAKQEEIWDNFLRREAYMHNCVLLTQTSPTLTLMNENLGTRSIRRSFRAYELLANHAFIVHGYCPATTPTRPWPMPFLVAWGSFVDAEITKKLRQQPRDEPASEPIGSFGAAYTIYLADPGSLLYWTMLLEGAHTGRTNPATGEILSPGRLDYGYDGWTLDYLKSAIWADAEPVEMVQLREEDLRGRLTPGTKPEGYVNRWVERRWLLYWLKDAMGCTGKAARRALEDREVQQDIRTTVEDVEVIYGGVPVEMIKASRDSKRRFREANEKYPNADTDEFEKRWHFREAWYGDKGVWEVIGPPSLLENLQVEDAVNIDKDLPIEEQVREASKAVLRGIEIHLFSFRKEGPSTSAGVYCHEGARDYVRERLLLAGFVEASILNYDKFIPDRLEEIPPRLAWTSWPEIKAYWDELQEKERRDERVQSNDS